MKNLILILALALLVIVPFLIWGDWFMSFFAEEQAIDHFQKYGSLGWVMGIVFLTADLFLPLPATIIMSVMGYLYGWAMGTLISFAGSYLSGQLAYVICYHWGTRLAVKIAGRKELNKGEKIFKNRGGWIVVVSRWLPVLPEVIACLAGIYRMPYLRFSVALACGTLPLALVFSYIGYTGQEHPLLAVGISALLPPILWFYAQYLIKPT